MSPTESLRTVLPLSVGSPFSATPFLSATSRLRTIRHRMITPSSTHLTSITSLYHPSSRPIISFLFLLHLPPPHFILLHRISSSSTLSFPALAPPPLWPPSLRTIRH